ncbi:nucleotidyltransferase [Tannerella sp. oral taxon BU063 isolate Cell 2]|uniref:Nucleotidyltransferase n=1 Tax=Tannerella sp. oral taxon BU063 isolate Cell 2 TaxID=1411148 RepID=W2C278_9BACT|nr:nucleotidyltransferase [Tannerella sp. oral taxon BU063 isolate Cell 2]
MNFLNQYNAQIADLCRRYSVERLFAFGSVLTDRFNDESDVDLIVDIADESPLEYADNYFNLKFGLSDLFGRPVDLLENKALRNAQMRKHIDESKQLIYAK